MITKETDYLPFLKNELEIKYKESYPDCRLEITDWRQQEIIRFQELMQEVVKGRVSEKWFYTHIKIKENTKMPRVDTLDLLSQFLGYANWSDFKKSKISNDEAKQDNNRVSFISKYNKHIFVLLLIIIGITITFATGIFSKVDTYKFCFADADSKEIIKGENIEVNLLHDDESPETIQLNENSCFELETVDRMIRFEVKAPYYKTDTIVRRLSNKKNEIIYLKQDDYALMIHVFSTSRIEDWKEQRDKMNKMFADEAEIYQIDKKERGIEIYNKAEFIDKMTVPLSSLKNIEIIDVEYKDEKIIMMRFIQ
jgi:hypothetical protein